MSDEHVYFTTEYSQEEGGTSAGIPAPKQEGEQFGGAREYRPSKPYRVVIQARVLNRLTKVENEDATESS
jgi:hypothetical protein